MTVAEQLVDLLYKAGIKRIYAVTGDSLNEVNDAVRRQEKIQWVHVRNEEAGAFAAGAEAQLTGLACCAGSSGPGHVHLVNGLYDAHRSDAPVLAIASTISSTEFGTGYFQETNTLKLFDDCSHYNQLAQTPKQLPRMLQAAVQHAIHRKGVAVLGLPGDLTKETAENSIAAEDFYPTQSSITPDARSLEEFAALIRKHDKITLFCGIGCAGAHQEVLALSTRLKAPVGYSFKGKMAVQHDNPNEIGMTGLLGLPAAYNSMHESGLLILLGTDFPYADFLAVKADIVQIETKPERIGRRAKVTLGLHGDVRSTIQALLPLLPEKTDSTFLDEQVEFYRKVKLTQQIYVEDRGKEEAIHPEYVASVINRLATDDAIFTVDTGMSCVWGARYIESTGKRTLLGSFNHGSMANAMPQAIGAALACPDRQVVALCGDGGMAMLLGELETIKQYALPIKLVVFNNRSLGMVKLEMEVAGLPGWQTDLPYTDYGAIAAAIGIRGLTVKDPDGVEEALAKAFSIPGPVLVNVLTDPNALAMPPKIELKQALGFARSMTKLMFMGRIREVIDSIKSNYKHIGEVI